jgi:hypothetical protein
LNHESYQLQSTYNQAAAVRVRHSKARHLRSKVTNSNIFSIICTAQNVFQMKFALVLLLTGSLLVASSHLKSWPLYWTWRHVPLPIFGPLSNPYSDSDGGEGDSYSYVPGTADGRSWTSYSKKVHQKFGFKLFHPTTMTVTSSFLTAIVSHCIPINQFAGQVQTPSQQLVNNAFPIQTLTSRRFLSTSPCAEEKRELVADFKPSAVEE